MTVIQTEHALSIGEIIRQGLVSGPDGEYRSMTFQVLREATEAEFLAFCSDSEAQPIFPLRPRFYVVSMD